MAKIIVQNTEITVLSHNDKDYISLTDMANGKQSESRAADVIKNWIRTRYTIEFLGTWEMIHNPDFKVVEFDHFRMQAGLPNFVMSVSEWIEKTIARHLDVDVNVFGKRVQNQTCLNYAERRKGQNLKELLVSSKNN